MSFDRDFADWMRDPVFAEAYGEARREIDKRDRLTGYATENVVPVTADDAMGPWLEAIVWATQADHEHNAYGWAGCSLCRGIEAERVSRRFPDRSYKAVAQRPVGEIL